MKGGSEPSQALLSVSLTRAYTRSSVFSIPGNPTHLLFFLPNLYFPSFSVSDNLMLMYPCCATAYYLVTWGFSVDVDLCILAQAAGSVEHRYHCFCCWFLVMKADMDRST